MTCCGLAVQPAVTLCGGTSCELFVDTEHEATDDRRSGGSEPGPDCFG